MLNYQIHVKKFRPEGMENPALLEPSVKPIFVFKTNLNNLLISRIYIF